MAFWQFNKVAPDRRQVDPPTVQGIEFLPGAGGIALVKWNDAIAAREAMTHPIVYRALNKLAEAVQQVKWYAEIDEEAPKADQRQKEKIVENINDLLHNPNDNMSPAMLRYWMALNYASFGRVPLKVSFSATEPDRPNGIYPLEADKVSVISNNRGTPAKYKYGSGQSAEEYVSRYFWKPSERKGFVDQIWKPGFTGYQHRDDSNTPLNAIGLPAQVVKALLIRAIKTANGHPNVRYLVTCSRTLTEAQKKALSDHLNEEHGADGPSAGKIPILQNASDVVIHKLDNDLSDIHSKTPSDDMARLVFGAFGIPIALAGMGASDGAKFASNYVESRLSFWEDTIIPGYVSPLISQGMTRLICPRGVVIRADLDSIPALVAGRMLAMKNASEVNFLTTDEKRKLFGFEPTTDIPQALGTAPAAPTAPNGSGENV